MSEMKENYEICHCKKVTYAGAATTKLCAPFRKSCPEYARKPPSRPRESGFFACRNIVKTGKLDSARKCLEFPGLSLFRNRIPAGLAGR